MGVMVTKSCPRPAILRKAMRRPAVRMGLLSRDPRLGAGLVGLVVRPSHHSTTVPCRKTYLFGSQQLLPENLDRGLWPRRVGGRVIAGEAARVSLALSPEVTWVPTDRKQRPKKAAQRIHCGAGEAAYLPCDQQEGQNGSTLI